MKMLAPIKRFLSKSASTALTSFSGLTLDDVRLGLLMAGGQSWAGRTVTVDNALTLDAVWACVRVIAESIATLPLHLYEGKGSPHATIAKNHPLYRVLHDQPNTSMSAVDFWSMMAGCLLTWGNAYAQIIWDNKGQVVALNPLRPDRMTVRVDPLSGSITYIYSYKSVVLTLNEDDIFHIRGFSLDGIMGLSPVYLGRQSMGTAMAAEEVAGRTFRNGLLTQHALSSPKFVAKDKADQAKAVLEGYTSSLNAGKIPLLEGGWTIEKIGMNPEDMQLLQTRGFSIETICRWFAVPPPIIGHMTKSTAWGSGLEQMMQWFLNFCLRAHLVRIEQAISRCLLKRGQNATHFAQFSVEGLLRANAQARAQLQATWAQNGIMTRNEIRALENRAPLPGGDDLTVQTNLIPIAQLGHMATLPAEKPLPGFNHPPDPPQEGEENDENE